MQIIVQNNGIDGRWIDDNGFRRTRTHCRIQYRFQWTERSAQSQFNVAVASGWRFDVCHCRNLIFRFINVIDFVECRARVHCILFTLTAPMVCLQNSNGNTVVNRLHAQTPLFSSRLYVPLTCNSPRNIRPVALQPAGH